MPNQYEHAPYTCVLCGEEETLRYSNDAAMRAARHCFTCNFWMERAAHPHPNAVITPDFEHFQAEQWGIRQARYKSTLGFGGRRWKVVWLDGREDTTNNLWYQGSIPERFRDRFAVNVKSLAEATSRAQHEAEYDPR